MYIYTHMFDLIKDIGIYKFEYEYMYEYMYL
jgi:hypothetical protein